MKTMPLFRRFIGSIIDKMMILLIFVIGFCIIEGESKSTSRGLTYLSLGYHAPSDYSYITLNSLYIIDYGYPVKYSHESEQEIVQRYETEDVEEIVRSFDLTITFSFIFLNILYYLLSESFLGVSVGKYLLKGRMVDNLIGERITSSDAFKRTIFGGLLMSLAVGLRYLFDVNYIIAIVMFFLIMDIPLFFKRRSLLDILSKVTCIDTHSNIDKDRTDINQIVVVEEKENAPTKLKEEPEVEEVQYTNPKKRWKFHFPRIPHIKLNGLKNNVQTKRAFFYVYFIWFALNITALAYALANPHMDYGRLFSLSGEKDTSAFYPFESNDIGNYDFSEFVVFTFAVPLCLFAIIKLILLFIPQKSAK